MLNKETGKYTFVKAARRLIYNFTVRLESREPMETEYTLEEMLVFCSRRSWMEDLRYRKLLNKMNAKKSKLKRPQISYGNIWWAFNTINWPVNKIFRLFNISKKIIRKVLNLNSKAGNDEDNLNTIKLSKRGGGEIAESAIPRRQSSSSESTPTDTGSTGV